MSLSKPPNEPLTSTEDSLLRHLASQASLVMRNAQLTAELRATIDELLASRRRLVEAQDAERRRIERNLHDGAQQQLIALAIQLGLLAESADDPDLDPAGHPRPQGAAQRRARRPARAGPRHLPAAAGRTGPGHGAARAGGPQPGAGRPRGGPGRPLPAGRREHRLLLHAGGAAERGQARPGLGRDRPPVRLRRASWSSRSATTAPASRPPARHGSGLQGMSDRLAAHGGTLAVRSQPGQGTTITGRLPTSERTAAAGFPRGQPGLN